MNSFYLRGAPTPFYRLLGVCLLAIVGVPTSYAAPLYDFARMTAETHPFLDAVPDTSPPLSPTTSGNLVRASALRARPASQVTPEPRSTADRRRAFYISSFLMGSVGTVDDISLSNGNTFETRHDQDLVGGLGIVLGYSWPRRILPLRAEVEYHYRIRMDWEVRDIDTPGAAGYSDNLSTHAVFLNGYYDYELNSKWTLYGGGGIGWVRNVSDVSRTGIDTPVTTKRTDETDNFGWNAAVGALWYFSEAGWNADFRYRYVDLGKVESGPHSDGAVLTAGSYTSHDFVIGISYSF